MGLELLNEMGIELPEEILEVVESVIERAKDLDVDKVINKVTTGHLVGYVLGVNPVLKETIQEMYKKDEERYIEYYNGFKEIQIPYLKTLELEKEDTVIKLFSIMCDLDIEDDIEFEQSEKIQKLFFELVKKGYRKVYTYIRDRKEIDLKQFLNYIRNTNDFLKHNVYFGEIIGLWYYKYCINYENTTKTIVGGFEVLETLNKFVNQLYINYGKILESDIFKPENGEKIEAIDKLIESGFNRQNEVSIEKFYCNLMEKDVENIKVLENIKISKYINPSFRKDLAREKGYYSRYFWMVVLTMRMFEIEPNIFFKDIMIKKEEMKKAFYGVYRKGKKTDEQILLNLLNTFVMGKIMQHLFFKTKDYYFEEKRKGKFLEYVEELNFLREEKKEILKKENELDKELSLVRKQNKKSLKEIEKLKKELAKKEKELSGYKQDKLELISLRNFMFNLNSCNESEKVIEDEDIMDIIRNKNAIVFGGDSDWQKKIKKEFPNWRYLGVETKNFDKNILNNIDFIVFFAPSIKSHGIYYKIIENINDRQKIIYVNNTNIDIVINDIKKALKGVI
ncbi:hypothetical protein N2W52_002047 [Clostridium perfringens]|nr:hypothetical protein [Clostridium perfringens]